MSILELNKINGIDPQPYAQASALRNIKKSLKTVSKKSVREHSLLVYSDPVHPRREGDLQRKWEGDTRITACTEIGLQVQNESQSEREVVCVLSS